MTRGRSAAAVALLLASTFAVVVPLPSAAEPILGDITVSGTVAYRDTSFIATGNITVLSGGDLTFDNTSVLMRLPYDEGLEVRVHAGGTLRIVNGSSFSSAFQSVAFSLHYMVFIEVGAHFVFTDSTIDFPYWVGVGDESAVIDNSTISHSLLGLFGFNLTVTRMTFISNNLGLWVSGNSLVRDSTFETSDVYGGILDGTSVVENSSFRGSITADLALLDRAVARNNTHLNSGRGVIALDNASVVGASMENMSIAGVQLGDQDFRYGCGVFISQPQSDWLNLHQFTFFHRTNNNVTIRDLSVENSPLGIAFGGEVWRRDNDTKGDGTPNIDDCVSDPPPRIVGAPLWNHVDWTVARPAVMRGGGGHFNGSLRILPGGSLTLDGGTWKFDGPGNSHSIIVDGGSLTLTNTALRSALIDFGADALNETPAATPNIDIFLNAGDLSIAGSTLWDIGTDSDPTTDTGIVAAAGAGPLRLSQSLISNSLRGLTLASGVQGIIDASTIIAEGPALVLRGGSAQSINSTLGSENFAAVFASSGSSSLHLYGSDAQFAGPGRVAIERFGVVRARVLWEDLRPIPGVEIHITDSSTGLEWGNLTSAGDGWAPAVFVPYRNTTWDGAGEQGGPLRLYRFEAAAGNASAASLPTDISSPVTVTLIVPDEGLPTISLNLPEEYYTNLSGAIVTGVAQDFETGVSVVELSLDGGPYINITTPSLPQLGPLNFSFTLGGLAEGIHVVAVRAWDSVGNTAEDFSYFVYDDHGPLLFDFPFELTTNRRDVIITGRLSEPGQVTIKGNTTNASSADGRFSLPMHLDQASELVEVDLVDLAGNQRTWTFVARLDEAPPMLSITSPANGSWVSAQRVSVSGLIEPPALLYLNGVPLSVSGVNNFTITAALSEGENLLSLTAVDPAGNRNEVVLTLFLDSVVPPLDILGPDNFRPFPSADLNLTLRTEPGATLTIGNDTYTAESALVVIPLHLSEGRNVLSVEARDLAGNTVRKSVALTVDTRAPTLSFAGGSTLTTANATLRVSGTTEPNALVRLGEYELQADASGSFAITLRLHPGENRVRVAARDGAGNEAVTFVTIQVDQPSLASPQGLAAPAFGPSILLAIGIAALVAAPFLVRWIARRRA